jgi:RHS repeat-associated protein
MELTIHYTGIGSEIREDALNNATKVVVNLPQGLGRYDIDSASEPSSSESSANDNAANTVPSFEWYLKNHLGSTMLVYGINGNEGSLKAAYDYRAFGEQVDLTMLTDKVTETFTGKELDDETELSYFGARYLDQMLGMWVSVDAKRQFNSPYLYAGNGANPVNGVDEDGAYLIRKRGGSYEIKTMSKAEAISGWVIKDVIPNFMKLPGLAFNIIKGVIDEKNSDKGFNGRNLQKDAIIKGTEKLVGMENIFVGKGIGAAFSSFDALVSYSIAMTDVDSPEFIAEFDSRMVSNGGDSYNSFPTPEAADAFAKDIQNSINQGNVTVGDPIIEKE